MRQPTPEYYRLLVLQAALRLELQGLKRSRSPSAYAAIKREFGLRGNRERVYTQFCELVEGRKQWLTVEPQPLDSSSFTARSTTWPSSSSPTR